jgi:hypothetical protein
VRLDEERRLVPNVDVAGLSPLLFRRSASGRGIDMEVIAGVDFAALGVGASMRIGLAAGTAPAGLVLAGECDGACPRTLLGSAQSALDAVARLGQG